MNNGVTTMENALRMVSDNIETYYKAGAPNGSWCISTCLNAASQFETMRAELQQLRHSQPTNEPLTLDEMRGMEGEPVYLVAESQPEPLKMWALVWIDTESDEDVYLTNNLGGQDGYRTDEGLRADGIAAYRYPPADK